MHKFPFCTFLALSQTALAANLTADQPKNHIGENAYCGVVASTHYAAQSPSTPTFVDPGQTSSESALHDSDLGRGLAEVLPEAEHLGGKRICVTGVISSYRGAPEIVAKSPGQITVH